MLYTSGSTGRPKGVEITHANVMTLLGGGSDVLPQPDDTVLLVTPLNFDISVLELWGALVAGARLVIAPPGRPDPRDVGRLIRERGVTFLSAASGVFSRLVDDALDDLARVRIAVSSADVLQPDAVRRLLAAHPHVRLINGYGPTETTVLCTGHEVFEVGADVPIGRPLPGYTARVAEDGELLIGGPGVARGYRDNPEATAERFVDGWYRTGDRVREDDDGVLHFVGRLDRQVKIGGVRVEPGEVEHALAAHPAVARAAVTVRTPVAGHPQLAAYATAVEGAQLDPEALRAHLAERLPQAYVPWTVIALDLMPLTERGKVDRDALPEPAAGGGEGGPVSEEALRVAGVMRELLRGELPGPDDDFFALGGDSLLAIALVGRLRALGHASLGVGAVFAHRTPRALAAALTEAVGPALPAITPRAGGALAPLTGAQRRTWLFGEMNPGARAYQHVGWVRIDGPLDPAVLRAALEALVDRHEALRSSIVVRDGEPFQRVHERVPIALEELDLRGAGSVAVARATRARARAKIDPSQAPWVRWDADTARRGAVGAALPRAPPRPRRVVVRRDHARARRALRRRDPAAAGAARRRRRGVGGRQRGGARRPGRVLGRGARPGSGAAAAPVRPAARDPRVVRRRHRAATASSRRRRGRPGRSPRRRARRSSRPAWPPSRSSWPATTAATTCSSAQASPTAATLAWRARSGCS